MKAAFTASLQELALIAYGGKEQLRLGSTVEGWELFLSMLETPALTVQCADPDRALRDHPLLDRQGDEVLDRGITTTVARARFELMGTSSQGPTTALTLIPRHAARLQRRTRPRSFKEGAFTRAGAMRTLVGEEPGVRFVCPARGESSSANLFERVREEKDRARERGQRPPETRAAGPSGIHRDAKLTVKKAPATAAQKELGERALRRAEALDAPPRATKALMEALIVESQVKTGAAVRLKDGTSRGPLQIQDTPTLVDLKRRGYNIDTEDVEDATTAFLKYGFTYITPPPDSDGDVGPARPMGAIEVARLFPSLSAGQVAQKVQGSAHPGRYDDAAREADEWIDAYDGGIRRGDAQPSRAAQSRGTPDEPESTWAMGVRISEEVRWAWMTHLDPIVVMGDERDLLRAKPALILRPHENGVDFLDGGWDAGRGVNRLSATVRLDDRIFHQAGSSVLVEDAGAQNGRYLLESLRLTSGEDAAQLELRRARDPKRPPLRVEVTASASGTTGASTSTSSTADGARATVRERIVAEAQATLTSKTGFRRYSQPGALTTDPTPPAPARTDCSQWVRAIYLKAGAQDPGTNTWSQAAKGKRTSRPKPGDLMMSATTGHVELYLGGGRTIGHGSPPIDYANVSGWPGHYFITYGFLDD